MDWSNHEKHDHYPIQKTQGPTFSQRNLMASATSLRPELHPRSAVDFVPTEWGRQVAPVATMITMAGGGTDDRRRGNVTDNGG